MVHPKKHRLGKRGAIFLYIIFKFQMFVLSVEAAKLFDRHQPSGLMLR